MDGVYSSNLNYWCYFAHREQFRFTFAISILVILIHNFVNDGFLLMIVLQKNHLYTGWTEERKK